MEENIYLQPLFVGIIYIKIHPTSAPRVPLTQYETVNNKKRESENSFYDLVFMSQGNRIQTYDLVLPKNPLRKMRQTPKETSEALNY